MQTGDQKDLPAWAKYLLGGIGGAVIAASGGIWANYSEFRKEAVQLNAKAAEQSTAASSEVEQVLEKFTLIHLGNIPNTDKHKELLRKSLKNAFEKAVVARNRWPSLEHQFDNYATSLTELNEAGDHLVDAYEGGRAFMDAYSNYQKANDDWQKAVHKKQGSYFASF